MTSRRGFIGTIVGGAALAAGLKAEEEPVRRVITRASTIRATLLHPAEPGDTTLRVECGHGARLRGNDVLLNTRTREQLLVTSYDRGTVTVVRGLTSVSCPMLHADTLAIVGSVYES